MTESNVYPVDPPEELCTYCGAYLGWEPALVQIGFCSSDCEDAYKESGSQWQAKTRVDAHSPIESLVPEGWWSTAQAARAVGRTPSTIRRWIREGRVSHSGIMKCGEIDVKLFDASDVEQMIQLAQSTRSGRPKKEIS